MACSAPPIDTPPPRVPDGERIYAISDIHGRLDLFQALVARIRRDNEARDPARVRLILLGDLVDRGPDSAELVARCQALSGRSGGFMVLKGNHEAMMVDALRGNMSALALWLRSGGVAALRSWGMPEAVLTMGASPDLIEVGKRHVPADTIAWIDGLPVSHLAGDYLFVHAGIRPGLPLASQSPQDMLWIRHEFLESEADHPFVVVHGHSISETGVVVRPSRIGIDTGAYRTNVLTALVLEGERRWTLSTGADDMAVPLGGLPARTEHAA